MLQQKLCSFFNTTEKREIHCVSRKTANILKQQQQQQRSKRSKDKMIIDHEIDFSLNLIRKRDQ